MLVGETHGRYDDGVPAAIERLGLRARVHELGWVPDSDTPALYSLAEIFAMPSLLEGFGLPPLEAMSCGTAVAASNTSSLPEVVADCGSAVRSARRLGHRQRHRAPGHGRFAAPRSGGAWAGTVGRVHLGAHGKHRSGHLAGGRATAVTLPSAGQPRRHFYSEHGALQHTMGLLSAGRPRGAVKPRAVSPVDQVIPSQAADWRRLVTALGAHTHRVCSQSLGLMTSFVPCVGLACCERRARQALTTRQPRHTVWEAPVVAKTVLLRINRLVDLPCSHAVSTADAGPTSWDVSG